MMMGFGFFGLFLILFFFVITIVAALAAISWLFPRPLSTPPQNSRICIHPPTDSNMRFTPYDAVDSEAPLEILKRRYARGEITREEYETMKKDILA